MKQMTWLGRGVAPAGIGARQRAAPLCVAAVLLWAAVCLGFLMRLDGTTRNLLGAPHPRRHAWSLDPHTRHAGDELPSLRRIHLSLLSHAAFSSPDDAASAEPQAEDPNTPHPSGFNTCPLDPGASPLHFSRTGERCVFPFYFNGSWHHDASAGVCAVQVGVAGVAIRLAPCDALQRVSADTGCVRAEGGLRCGWHSTEVSCQAPIRNGTCVCRGRVGGVVQHVRCRASPTSCSDVCRRAVEDVMSASHAASRDAAPSELVRYIAALAARNAPQDEHDLPRWRDYAADLPEHDLTKRLWCGRGIVLMAGSITTLPQALATVSYIRGQLQSNLPVEVWQAASEATNYSPAFKRGLSQLGVVVRELPEEAKSPTAKNMFSLKPAVVLASSFDEVLYFDADALPLVDPMLIIEERMLHNTTAVFWPDYWTLLWDAKIWDAIGGWPFGESKHAPSQESGLMVVCKSCGGWKPLALAFYFNYHSNIYYQAIYVGHFDEQMCGTIKCVRNGRSYHVMPGMGDKDTFHLSYMALNVSFKMMAPSVLGGPMLPRRGVVCGTSILHRGTAGLIALHHNSNKWWWKDFAQGKWNATGLLLSHVMSFKNDKSAYHADGQNEWDSVTYNWRSEMGTQPTPDGARWCIIYRGETLVTTMEDALGYDLESVLLRYYTAQYSAPWLIDWIDSVAGDTLIERRRFEADTLYLACAVAILIYFVWQRCNVMLRRPHVAIPRLPPM